MADRALLLGINEYRAVSDLRGCVNDVENMRSLLTDTFGFRGEIRTLTDAEVTRRRIEPQVEWLFEGARPGDRLLLHFSGHGSYTLDLSGDEEDERDELICLHDMDFDDPESYVIDEQLGAWLDAMPDGVELTVVLDNCHSGTGTRKVTPRGLALPPEKVPLVALGETTERVLTRLAPGGVAMRGAAGGPSIPGDAYDPTSEASVLARFVEPPEEIQRRWDRVAVRSRAAGPALKPPTDVKYLLLSACRADQTAADAYIGGRFNGAFTYHLCRILREAGPDLDRQELMRRLSRAMAGDRFAQIPQIEPLRSRGPVFNPPREEEGEGDGEDGGRERPDGPDRLGEIVDGPGGGEGESEPEEVEEGGGQEGEGGSEFLRRVEELREACDRVIEAARGGAEVPAPGRPPRVSGGPRRRDRAGQRHLVYVHGICEHPAGYSEGWWRALAPFAPSIRPGRLGGDRHEVLWSDVVRGGRRAAGGSEEERELRDRLVETLEDRAQRQVLDAAPAGEADAARGAEAEESARGLGVPGIDCINDFVRYLTDDDVRDRVIGRFREVVLPLLRDGAELELIAHSWGTVVAYEGLRGLDGSRFDGFVRNFFTVGSALSIGEVKRQLRPMARDGRKPRLVRRWINLDARFDIVGGHLRGRPFEVDAEFLSLEPIGCVPAFIPNPACAHASYFRPENVQVNREIFGEFIGRGV